MKQVLVDKPVEKKPKCHNCKHASSSFKIGNKTHHQCNHPKHEEGFNNGTLSPWDTLQEFYNTCESHEYKTLTHETNPHPERVVLLTKK